MDRSDAGLLQRLTLLPTKQAPARDGAEVGAALAMCAFHVEDFYTRMNETFTLQLPAT